MPQTPVTGEIAFPLPPIWKQGEVDSQNCPIADDDTVFVTGDVRITFDNGETFTNVANLPDAAEGTITLTAEENVEGSAIVFIDQDSEWVALPCCWPYETETENDVPEELLDVVNSILAVVQNKPIRDECEPNDRMQLMRGDDFTGDRAKMFPLNVVIEPPADSKAVLTVRGLYCDTLLLEVETENFQSFDGEYSAVFELPKFMELEKPGIHKFDVEYRPSGGRVETVAWGEMNLIEDQTRPEAT